MNRLVNPAPLPDSTITVSLSWDPGWFQLDLALAAMWWEVTAAAVEVILSVPARWPGPGS